MATAVTDLNTLLNGIPPGAWVAVSESRHKVLAHGADPQAVFDQARQEGEQHPLIVRVPDQASAMFF